MWGKWHLGSAEERFPTNQGFDEWYGIPRTYDEAMWPSSNETKSLWPSVGNKQGWNAKVVHPEHIYEARKGEKPRQVAVLDVDRRRTMEAEITTRAVEFIKRQARRGQAVLCLRSILVGSHADAAESGVRRPNGQRRLGRLPRRDGPPHRTDPRCHQGSRHRRQHARRLHQRQRAGGDEPLAGRQRAVAGHLFHRDGGLAARAVHHPLAGQSAGRAASATRSFTSSISTRPSRTSAERMSRRIARSTASTSRISSSANRRLPTAKDSRPTWPTGYRL